MALLLCALFFYASCSSVQTGGERWRTGWVDGRTFRVSAVGACRGKARSRRGARYAAVLMAHKIVTENFTAARYDVLKGMGREYRDVRREVAREFSEVIMSGEVVSETGYAGNIYRIVYEVRGSRLRERVTGIPR